MRKTANLLILLLVWWPLKAQNVQFEGGSYFLEGELYSGQLIDYYDDGSISSTLTIHKGLPNDSAIYLHANGQLKTKGVFVDGRKHATWVHWDESGNKIREFHYNHGLKDGTWNVWYPNGQLHFSMHYDLNESVGTWNSYLPDGELIKSKTYTGP